MTNKKKVMVENNNYKIYDNNHSDIETTLNLIIRNLPTRR